MKYEEAKKLWHEAVERIKDETMAPTLWRALELGTGITKEGDFFVVGFLPSDSPMSGHLTSSEHKIKIERILTTLLGSPTRIKIIEGTTQADYESFKKRESLAEAGRRASQERRQVGRAAEKLWETIGEQCSRKYANTPLRQMPQVRGQYLLESAQIISDEIDKIYPDGQIDEVGHRSLARVIEKVATLADVPGAVVAVEVVRLRRERSGG